LLLDLYFLAISEEITPTGGFTDGNLTGVVFGKRDFDKRLEKLPKAVKKAIKKAVKKDTKIDREKALRDELAKINADIEASYIELMELERDRRIESMIRDELQRIERERIEAERIADENDVLTIMLLMG